MNNNNNNYYEVLGIDASATVEEIKKAWKKLEYEAHPDRHPDDPEMADRFRAGKDAYDCLSDASQRAAHDEWLAQQARAAAPAKARPTLERLPAKVMPPQPVPHPTAPPRRNNDNSGLHWAWGVFGVGAVVLGAAAAHRYAPRDASGRHRDRHTGQYRSGYFA